MWLPKLVYEYFPSEWRRLRCFLYKNLPLHRAPVLESFSLDLRRPSRERPDEIKRWVVIAISHFVRELKIVYRYAWNKPNILPNNLYTCKSLVILKLHGEFLVDFPQMVFLPSLKTFKLESVRYSSEESLQLLLSNCPILQNLSVYLCEKDITGKLTVVVPSLQSLALCIPHDHDIEGIVIVTPLKNLEIEDHIAKDHHYMIESMPNLIDAFVDVALPNINSLIGSITSVKHLTICSKATYDEDFVFNQLEHLELCTCKEHSSNLLVKLLKDSSNLQILELIAMDDEVVTFYWNQPSTVPKCILSSLQTLKLLEYEGKP